MRVVRIYHAGRDAAHRQREGALVRAGVELTLVVPSSWPGPDQLAPEPGGADGYEIVPLPVRRPGDVNRHRLADGAQLAAVLGRVRPDVLDLHEEPFSALTRQVVRLADPALPIVGYTAQNLDKRFPPPFHRWERDALARWDGLYPCSRQAASVATGKGFHGAVRVLPLPAGADFVPGTQEAPDGSPLHLLLVGRLVPEKGVRDAVRVLAAVRAHGPAELRIVGSGPEREPARRLAAELGVAGSLTLEPWLPSAELAERCRRAHVLLAPSRATPSWVEQFGRMVVEAQAAGAVVVGYASGALPEVIGAAGIVVGEGDVGALAAAVLALRADPARWQALRAAGLAARPHLTWDAVAAGQVELYGAAQARSRLIAARRRAPAQRARAVAQWGAPARVPGPARPFALPVLRANTPATRMLARLSEPVGRDGPAAATPPRLRVVYLDHVARLSGGEIALERLLAALPGIDAHVILAEDGPLRPRLAAAGASVEVLPLDPRTRDTSRTQAGVRTALGLAGYTLRLAGRLRALRPDLVHTNSLKSGYYGSVAARLARVPVIWHVRDRIAADYLPARAVRVTRIALRRLPDAVLCNSAETRATTRTTAAVIHDPYDPPRSQPAQHDAGLVVGMLGRIAPWKGQDVFLRAVATAFPGRGDVSARIIGAPLFGEDDFLAVLHRLAAELDVPVEFTGFVADAAHELAGLDVLVHASTVPEPFGQVVVEGMAAGLAVLAADAGGPREIITHGVDGLLVAPGDVAALGAALREVSDPARRAELGRAAVARAADFAPAVIAPDVEALYRSVVEQSSRGARKR